MVGGEEDAPGIVDEQEQLEPDRPLQRVDEVLVAIAERHQPAAAVAFDVHGDPFVRRGEARLRYCAMVSPDAVTVWPNMIWPTSTVTLGVRFTASASRAAADEKCRSPSVP